MPYITVEEDAPVRRDVDSDDVRRTHPELPCSYQERIRYLMSLDLEAYAEIKHQFPDFTPPGFRRPES